MKVSRIKIKDLFGIKDCTLDGKSIELSGKRGSGKTSVLDSICLALTNRSDRDYIIRQGVEEGEIIIETDSGMTIDRHIHTQKADKVTVRRGSMLQSRPAEFLRGIFTPLQLDPMQFTQLPRQEKNRVILSLIQFDWDVNWIKEQFGEIPQGVDYSKHILEVLADIQSEKGVYFQSRQGVNRDIRNKQAFIEEIASTLPDNYQADKWEAYPTAEKYRKLEQMRHDNDVIRRAKAFKDDYESKKRGLKADLSLKTAAIDDTIRSKREQLTGTIERLKAEIIAAEDKLSGLDAHREEQVKVAQAEYETALAKLERDTGTADQYVDKEETDVSGLAEELATAEEMKKHLNEYHRMTRMQDEVAGLQEEAEGLTSKIELARELPAQILSEATIPIDGLTVEGGIPLINGLPISNLSDGELLELCVDITVSKPGQLEIILVDGAERLDSESRKKLYQKCKDKGLQLIATRVTDSDELEVIEL